MFGSGKQDRVYFNPHQKHHLYNGGTKSLTVNNIHFSGGDNSSGQMQQSDVVPEVSRGSLEYFFAISGCFEKQRKLKKDLDQRKDAYGKDDNRKNL